MGGWRRGRSAVVALALSLAGVCPAPAQTDRLAPRAVTAADIDDMVETQRVPWEVRELLGPPLFARCDGRIEIWTYRTARGRIDLMFVNGRARMTVHAGVGSGNAGSGECS